MNDFTRLALARIHCADVARHIARQLREAKEHDAAKLVIEHAMAAAESLAHEREIAARTLQEHEQ